MKLQKQKIIQLAPELALYHYNEIPVLVLNHSQATAEIALQGAQLLSWTPHHQTQSVVWLSEVEPFILGSAIRGGIPLCYPWFGAKKMPAHGSARLRLWELSHYQITQDKTHFEFVLLNTEQQLEAKVGIDVGTECRISFTHYGEDPAQIALHSYFNLGNINQVELRGLPKEGFNSLLNIQENVASPRKITELVDFIYPAINHTHNSIIDEQLQRQIHIHHNQASDIVLWNPWHKATSAMTSNGYQTMVCIETARINQPVQQGKCISVEISVEKI